MPQLIAIIMLVLSLSISASQHGKPKIGTHDFMTSFISVIIWFSILYFGNFFKQY